MGEYMGLSVPSLLVLELELVRALLADLAAPLVTFFVVVLVLLRLQVLSQIYFLDGLVEVFDGRLRNQFLYVPHLRPQLSREHERTFFLPVAYYFRNTLASFRL